MSPAKALLGLGFIVVAAFVGTYVGVSGGPNPKTPHSVDGSSRPTTAKSCSPYNGGMDIPRGTLFLTIEHTESDDERIPDLGTNDNPWVVSPFSGETVTEGDTLVLAEPERRDTVIYLNWNGSEGTSILASYDPSPSDR